jgi:uncharacterized membrane protein HdeD (DUF308 family)
MGLSEHEQRMLDELERSLKEEDATLAAKLERSSSVTPRRIIAGALVMVAGISALVFGVIAHLVVAGAIGFVAMFAGVLLATSKVKLEAPKSGKQEPGFFDRRWDKRG